MAWPMTAKLHLFRGHARSNACLGLGLWPEKEEVKGQGTIDWPDIIAMYVVTVPARVLGHEKCLQ